MVYILLGILYITSNNRCGLYIISNNRCGLYIIGVLYIIVGEDEMKLLWKLYCGWLLDHTHIEVSKLFSIEDRYISLLIVCVQL